MGNEQVDNFENVRKRIETNWYAVRNLARRTVETSHEIGKDLLWMRDRVPHGEWLPLLQQVGIEKSTASRLMTLGRMQISQIAQFATVSAALSSVKEQRALPLGNNDTRRPEIVDGQPEGNAKRVGNERPAEASQPTSQAAPARNEPETEPVDERDFLDETEVLRMRAEAAEQEANDARLALQEERDRREAVTQELSEADDSPQALAVLQETESATQATVRARDELARVQARLQNAMRTIDAQNRRINGIKRDLLAGMAGGDVLVKYYGVEGNGETEYRNDALLEGE